MTDSHLDGKSIGLKIKGLRQERDMSMRELASRANLAVSYISKLEAGNATPTVTALHRILLAMDADIYEFFRDKAKNNVSEKVIFKKADMVVTQDGDREWYYAFPRHPEIKFEMTYEEYQPHTKVVEKEAYKGDMCGYVLSGELTLEVAGQGVFKAEAGDAFYVKAGRLHQGKNNGDEILRIIAVQQQ